jgi:hypothetical protein
MIQRDRKYERIHSYFLILFFLFVHSLLHLRERERERQHTTKLHKNIPNDLKLYCFCTFIPPVPPSSSTNIIPYQYKTPSQFLSYLLSISPVRGPFVLLINNIQGSRGSSLTIPQLHLYQRAQNLQCKEELSCTLKMRIEIIWKKPV